MRLEETSMMCGRERQITDVAESLGFNENGRIKRHAH